MSSHPHSGILWWCLLLCRSTSCISDGFVMLSHSGGLCLRMSRYRTGWRTLTMSLWSSCRTPLSDCRRTV
ncbi:hypothetical protein [Phocaeicola vulgatus]|uniref:hypothetical protein n=1 Tax=Phocaeicola vulgatus TaxID=821 RepID=UPI001E60CEC2|nr:hypothetical protein [Phocaeicola vulgatus]MDB1069126.1 hypothetical protein [Phocaeicola vulgatus]